MLEQTRTDESLDRNIVSRNRWLDAGFCQPLQCLRIFKTLASYVVKVEWPHTAQGFDTPQQQARRKLRKILFRGRALLGELL